MIAYKCIYVTVQKVSKITIQMLITKWKKSFLLFRLTSLKLEKVELKYHQLLSPGNFFCITAPKEMQCKGLLLAKPLAIFYYPPAGQHGKVSNRNQSFMSILSGFIRYSFFLPGKSSTGSDS